MSRQYRGSNCLQLLIPKSWQRFLVTHPNTQQVKKIMPKIPNPRNVGLVILLSTIGPVIEINNTHIRQVVQNSLRVALPIFEKKFVIIVFYFNR